MLGLGWTIMGPVCIEKVCKSNQSATAVNLNREYKCNRITVKPTVDWQHTTADERTQLVSNKRRVLATYTTHVDENRLRLDPLATTVDQEEPDLSRNDKQLLGAL